MRGRSIAAALLAALASGCGSSSAKHTSPSSSAQTQTVTLSLSGSTENLNAVACGKQEPFEHYAAPAQVRYTGQITPAPRGRYKVKLKLKLCHGGRFVDTTAQKIVGQPSGRFDGVLAITRPGAYSLRAGLEPGDRPQSQKAYVQVR